MTARRNDIGAEAEWPKTVSYLTLSPTGWEWIELETTARVHQADHAMRVLARWLISASRKGAPVADSGPSAEGQIVLDVGPDAEVVSKRP